MVEDCTLQFPGGRQQAASKARFAHQTDLCLTVRRHASAASDVLQPISGGSVFVFYTVADFCVVVSIARCAQDEWSLWCPSHEPLHLVFYRHHSAFPSGNMLCTRHAAGSASAFWHLLRSTDRVVPPLLVNHCCSSSSLVAPSVSASSQTALTTSMAALSGSVCRNALSNPSCRQKSSGISTTYLSFLPLPCRATAKLRSPN